jgi:hypothetical protein
MCFALSAILINSARAFPGSGGNCASCHSDSNGTFNISPTNLLELLPGQTGQLTLNATAIPAGAEAAFGVDGLDAANLMATAGAGWTPRSGGNWYTSAIFNTVPQAIALPVTLGAGSMAGDYTVDVRLAGTGGWSRSQTFTLRVLVPEPATIGFVVIALVSAGVVLRRRINRRITELGN